MASAGFLKTIMTELFRCGDAKDIMWDCLERWSKLDKFMNAIVNQIVSIPSFIWPVVGFMKKHVNSNIDECRLMQLRAETGKNISKAYLYREQIVLGRNKKF